MDGELEELKYKLDNDLLTAEWYLSLSPMDRMAFHMQIIHLECEDKNKYSLNEILEKLNKPSNKTEYILHDKRNNTFSEGYPTYNQLKEHCDIIELKEKYKHKYCSYFKVVKHEYELKGNEYIKCS